MPQLAVRNRYDQQSQQLGQDIAGTISGAYEGYQKGKERQETSRLRGIQTQSAEMTLEQQMRKIEEAKTSKKAFETLKKGAMDEIRAGMQNQASMARGEKILKMYDSIQFEGGKGVDKLAKYTATKQELDDFSKKSKDEKLGLGDYPVEYISAGSGLFQKSYEKAKQSALGKKQIKSIKEGDPKQTKEQAISTAAQQGGPATQEAKEVAGGYRTAAQLDLNEHREIQAELRASEKEEADYNKLESLRIRAEANVDNAKDDIKKVDAEIKKIDKAIEDTKKQISDGSFSATEDDVVALKKEKEDFEVQLRSLRKDMYARKSLLGVATERVQQSKEFKQNVGGARQKRYAELEQLPATEQQRIVEEFQPQVATRTRAPLPTKHKLNLQDYVRSASMAR